MADLSFDLKRVRRKIQEHAYTHDLLSDATAISYPIPLITADGTLCIEFMLYYAIPSEANGRNNPDISMPYAFIGIDLVTMEVVKSTEKQPEGEYQPCLSMDALATPPDELLKLRTIYAETIPKVLQMYWQKPQVLKIDVDIIEGYGQMNEILFEAPLVDEYRKLNPHFFAWLKSRK